jgi:hypothetical protein
MIVLNLFQKKSLRRYRHASPAPIPATDDAMDGIGSYLSPGRFHQCSYDGE